MVSWILICIFHQKYVICFIYSAGKINLIYLINSWLFAGAVGRWPAAAGLDPQLHQLHPPEAAAKSSWLFPTQEPSWIWDGEAAELELPPPDRGPSVPLHPRHVPGHDGGQVPGQRNSSPDSQPTKVDIFVSEGLFNKSKHWRLSLNYFWKMKISTDFRRIFTWQQLNKDHEEVKGRWSQCQSSVTLRLSVTFTRLIGAVWSGAGQEAGETRQHKG